VSRFDLSRVRLQSVPDAQTRPASLISGAGRVFFLLLLQACRYDSGRPRSEALSPSPQAAVLHSGSFWPVLDLISALLPRLFLFLSAVFSRSGHIPLRCSFPRV
jgi:hypothetical protein